MKKPWWDKTEFGSRRQALAARAQVLTAVRHYFSNLGFTEVETPILQVSPGLDRHVRPLATAVKHPFQAQSVRRYLHTSPEFAMKKLLAAGETHIFQICRVFRDEEQSAHHTPEFTMLEWYRVDADYRDMMTDLERLIQAVASAVQATHLGQGKFVFAVDTPWQRLSLPEAFASMAGIDLLSTLGEGCEPSVAALRAAGQKTGVRCDENQTWDDIFHRVLLESIEPQIAEQGPHFLMDYPTVTGALARRKPDQPALCERVEAYACGLELANGYSELTDPDEQRERFERDRAHYRSLYGSPPPVDEDFLDALQHMPQAAGMALGVDRLIMLLTGATDIHDVQWAPLDLGGPEDQ